MDYEQFMKYYFITLEIQDGLHGYFSYSVIESDKTLEEVSEQEASTWYDYEDAEDGDYPRKEEGEYYYYPVEDVTVSVYAAREISKEHFDILTQYI